jgi:dTDP-4-amino-4,6-dideoxy-D-galactose acyltransferase
MTIPSEDFDELPWDSQLFGFPVARLRAAAITSDRFMLAMAALRAGGIRLAYGLIPWKDGNGRSLFESIGAHMVDRKTRFRKHLASKVSRFPDGVELWPSQECPTELEALALASGHQSRFRIDPRVPSHVFQELYLAWIRRSVLGEIAQAVLISREAGKIAGMVTLSSGEGVAEIGLLAVDRVCRGKGVGKRLMAASETWAVECGAASLEVVTQGANAEACALYAASGLDIVDQQAVYHVWMEERR